MPFFHLRNRPIKFLLHVVLSTLINIIYINIYINIIGSVLVEVCISNEIRIWKKNTQTSSEMDYSNITGKNLMFWIRFFGARILCRLSIYFSPWLLFSSWIIFSMYTTDICSICFQTDTRVWGDFLFRLNIIVIPVFEIWTPYSTSGS